MRFFIAILALVLLAGLSPLGAADMVRVRAAPHEPPGKDAYGRIVFEWPAPVPYKATVEAGKLVVRFEQPFSGRLNVVTRYLGDYVTSANVEDEGRTVTFPLKAAYRLKTYADGGTVVLDLIRGKTAGANTPPKTAAGTPPKVNAPRAATPPAPKPLASAAPPPVLPVRAGDHEGFGRLVFDWARNVDYTVSHEGDRATIRFSQPAKLDYAALGDRLPKTVKAVGPTTGDSGVALTLTLVDNARLRHFRSGTSVVLDVLEPAVEGRATAPATVPRRAPQSRAPLPSKPGASAVVAPPPAPIAASAPSKAPAPSPSSAPALSQKSPAASAPSTAAPAAAASGQVTPSAAAAKPAATSAAAPPANLLARPAPELAPAAMREAAPPTQSLDDVLAGIPGMAPPRASMPVTPSTAKKAAPQPAAAPRPPASTPPGRWAPIVHKPAADSRPSSASAATADQRVVIHPLGTINDLGGLRFTSPQDVAVAVYERSGYLWLVFDHRMPAEIAGVWPRTAVKPQMVATSTNDVTLLRWPVPAGRHPGLRREGNDWIVDILTTPAKPPTDIKPETHVAAADGPNLLLRNTGFALARELRDPEVGDQLWVVPMTVAGRGTAAERRLVELHLLGTLQGLAIKPLADELVVRNIPDGVEVTMPGGLHLTGNILTAEKSSSGGPSGQTPIPALATRSGKLFDFESWGAGKGGSFFDRKGVLQRAVMEAPKTSRNAARLALAQFFFAHGHAADTLGILQVIDEDDPIAVKDPAFRALRGASRYLAGDYAAAGPDLFDSGLDMERETALWRGALLASQNDWLAASRYFAQADNILRNYPTDLRIRFGLLAAESSFMIGDSGLAKFQLDKLASLNPARIWQDQIDYLQGKVLVKANDVAAAAAAWERAMAGVHRPTKVKAQFARAEMLLANKRMTPGEAIDEIERLRFAWRGDEIELSVLKRLGELYIDVADYRNGLQTLREAMTYFPKSSDSRVIDARMRAAFAALYIGDEADKLPPLTALALYDDFHDLTPAGEAGDVVASKLVDRLVGVELLDRAAEVMKTQIETRLKGEALADAVNRLGVIHLLARQPEEALAVLNGRLPPDATPTTVAQRRQLKARTLGELARYKDALALLEGDNSRDADRLRAEIGWRTQNWPLAASAFGRLVPEAVQTLTDADRQTVLRLAITQALNNNAVALKDLRKRYGAGMAQTAFKESFDLVTAPGESPALDLRAITRQVGEVDQFRAFLTSYRDKLLPRRETAVKPVTSDIAKGAGQTAAAN